MKKKSVTIFSAGLITGIVLVAAIWCFAGGKNEDLILSVSADKEPVAKNVQQGGHDKMPVNEQPLKDTLIAVSKYNEWIKDSVYNGGDKVIHNSRIYKAKWWSQNEEPGKTDVWEATLETLNLDVMPNDSELRQGDEIVQKIEPIRKEDFKVVGYYPSWKPESTAKIRYDVLTHVIYAFAIPNSEGGLNQLENEETAKQIITDAHKNNTKVLLAVGGWSYNDTPLEPTFMSATDSPYKIKLFGDAILAMCDKYGFDGVDMDWEHPRKDGNSAAQYESLMLYLSDKLHDNGKILTSAVISGATPEGNIYYDAAAHSDKVLEAVDWFNVMAYDGGDGDRHSTYDFAVNCGKYWRDTRQLSPDKVVLGVPFYGRPSWASYEDILKSDNDAWKNDMSLFNGIKAYYNGIDTIKKKTVYASDNLGGIMIWEITQDTSDYEKSLITAIGQVLIE